MEPDPLGALICVWLVLHIAVVVSTWRLYWAMDRLCQRLIAHWRPR